MFVRLGRLAARLSSAFAAAWIWTAARDSRRADGGEERDAHHPWTPWRMLRAVILVAMSALGVAALVGIYRIGAHDGGSGFDALCYWDYDLDHLYGGTYGALFFSYAPPMALAFLPGHLLSFDAFRTVWLAVQVLGLVWLTRRYALALLLFLPISVELYNGNIHLLLAAAIVLSFRWPAAWALVLLTKVTPGVALLWYVVRREWHNLAIALGATAAISLATMAIVPSQWLQWFEFLVSNPTPDTTTFHITVPLSIRLACAALLVVYGARTDRRWTVPVAAMIALPVMWINGLAMLAALVTLMPGDLAAMKRDRPAAPKSRSGRSRWRIGSGRLESSEGGS